MPAVAMARVQAPHLEPHASGLPCLLCLPSCVCFLRFCAFFFPGPAGPLVGLHLLVQAARQRGAATWRAGGGGCRAHPAASGGGAQPLQRSLLERQRGGASPGHHPAHPAGALAGAVPGTHSLPAGCAHPQGGAGQGLAGSGTWQGWGGQPEAALGRVYEQNRWCRPAASHAVLSARICCTQPRTALPPGHAALSRWAGSHCAGCLPAWAACCALSAGQ